MSRKISEKSEKFCRQNGKEDLNNWYVVCLMQWNKHINELVGCKYKLYYVTGVTTTCYSKIHVSYSSIHNIHYYPQSTYWHHKHLVI